MKEVIIIGAGISGLTLANTLLEKYNKDEILILESNNRIGGLIRTTIENGFLTEWGPEGLRGKSDNTEHIFSLINEPSIPATEQASIRYLIYKQKLTKLPTGPLSAITTPLMSFRSKLRIFKEPFIKKKDENETIADFFVRRLGPGVYPLIDAFIAGVYGGNASEISVEHAFPSMKQYERESGSIIRGAIAAGKQKRKERKENGQKRDKKKYPFLKTTQYGMGGIVNSLANNVHINLNQKVTKVECDNGHYRVHTPDKTYSCKKLIFATGPNHLQNIDICNEPSVPKTDEARITVLSLGFNESDFEKPIRGYGLLTPTEENTFVLGVLFTSKLFTHHSPNGNILLRAFIGGVRHPNYNKLSDDEMISKTLDEFRRYLGLKEGKNPIYIKRVSHYPKGIPQMTMSHDSLLEWRENIEQKYPNLYFTGVGWTSIACDGLIGEAIKLSKRL